MMIFFEILSILLSCQQGNTEWEYSKPNGIFFEFPLAPLAGETINLKILEDAGNILAVS